MAEADAAAVIAAAAEEEPVDAEFEKRRPDIEGVKREPRTTRGRGAVEQAAADASGVDESAAVEFLLEAFDGPADDAEPVVDKLRINVGTKQHPRWIPWHITPVDGAVIRRIRETAANQRSLKRGGGSTAGLSEAAFRADLEVVVEGTVAPDVREIALSRGVQDPSMLVLAAFNKKQGLVTQLAAEVMDISGYSDEDVEDDAVVVRAVGNSSG